MTFNFPMSRNASPISKRIEALINFDKLIFFVFLVLLYLIIRFLINDTILKSIPGYEELSDGTFTYFHIFNTLNYVWTPFAILWKITVATFIIWVGSFALGYKVPFQKLWQFILVAEIVFIFPELFKLLYFITPANQVTPEDIQNFYPLSLLSLINVDGIHPKYYYPLRALNLFEMLYWILLILGFHTLTKRSIREATLVVFSSYVVCFMAWLLFYIIVYKP